jgi:hypothetical protein
VLDESVGQWVDTTLGEGDEITFAVSYCDDGLAVGSWRSEVDADHVVGCVAPEVSGDDRQECGIG